MSVRTFNSERARNHWGEMMDSAIAGDVVQIERHNRPVAVLISQRTYERLQADHMRLLEYIKAGNPADDIPWEQVKAEMDAQLEPA